MYTRNIQYRIHNIRIVKRYGGSPIIFSCGFRPNCLFNDNVVVPHHSIMRRISRISSSSSSNSYNTGFTRTTTKAIRIGGGGSTKTTVWERSAKSIKNTDFENSDYLDTLRTIHDPSLHIKTIEDEIKGTYRTIN
jgi:hypothetical protein